MLSLERKLPAPLEPAIRLSLTWPDRYAKSRKRSMVLLLLLCSIPFDSSYLLFVAVVFFVAFIILPFLFSYFILSPSRVYLLIVTSCFAFNRQMALKWLIMCRCAVKKLLDHSRLKLCRARYGQVACCLCCRMGLSSSTRDRPNAGTNLRGRRLRHCAVTLSVLWAC